MGTSSGSSGSAWSRYFRDAISRAGYDDIDARGGAARFARDIGVSESNVSRWANGVQPNIDACRKLAAAWGVPLLEVLVAAGTLTQHEARWSDRPAVNVTRWDRVQRVLDDPNTPDAVRRIIELILRDITTVIEEATPPSRRAI